MPDTVFYAWQSDLPANVNKNFIRDAIDRAVEALNLEVGVEDALRADQDTQGVAGDVNVAEVIFDKIDRCRVFVADITTITPQSAARPSPNPNVLIEYGRASVRPGSECVITVFNESFGQWETERPFDLRHRRRPLLYTLPANPSPEQRAAARRALVSQLTSAIRDIMAMPPTSAPIPVVADFAFARSLYSRTTFRERTGGRIIGFWAGFRPIGRSVTLASPWDRRDLIARHQAHQFQIGNIPVTFSSIDNGSSSGERFDPIQGGARYLRQIHYARDHSPNSRMYDDAVAFYVHEDGLIALAVRTNNLEPVPRLSLQWIMAELANGLLTLDRVRRTANQQNANYALVVELRYDQQTDDSNPPVPAGEWRLNPPQDESGHLGPLLRSDPITIGPILVGDRSTFPTVLKEVYTRVWTSANRRPDPLSFPLGENV